MDLAKGRTVKLDIAHDIPITWRCCYETILSSALRADYGPARRTLQMIQAEPGLELSILVTGMHLDPAHGETWQEIARDGFTIAAFVHGQLRGDSLAAMAGSIGLYLYTMSQVIPTAAPDIVIVLGDRGEQLAGAMAAAFQNIVVVHLCGGSLSGSIDDSIRHAITKFAHYHLPASENRPRINRWRMLNPERSVPAGGNINQICLSSITICHELVYPRFLICCNQMQSLTPR